MHYLFYLRVLIVGIVIAKKYNVFVPFYDHLIFFKVSDVIKCLASMCFQQFVFTLKEKKKKRKIPPS